ncbi:hypothetical protein [Anaeromyxobacter sp. Fw109-5]|uniref:hypothetical protein n=1 Tax=Anaeromyxobacter sp. (strain Fw109-5) TaxID=404589 RepID=UPI0002D73926|nr:hypothetical protein [Anaeromyxobacter sp. Fw109-5]
MRSLASSPALLAALIALSGCDWLERIQNDRVLAGVLIESPGVSQPAQGVELSGAVVATVFFGEMERGANPVDAGSWSTTGLDGATVRLTWAGGSATLEPVPGVAGQYALAGDLTYEPGTAYTFRVDHDGETYSGTVVAPARPTLLDADGAELPIVQPPVAHAQIPGPYVLRREGDSVAFYAVTQLSSRSGAVDASAATCTNAPDVADPMAVLRLFLDDGAWRAPTFSLAKADCFPTPAPQYGYGLLLTAVNKVGGSNLSSNLFIGSGVVAGSSAASVLPLR